jgi:nitroimidazol reductase NimA-like FMN-containing flavoprotein (pyridoxamine 5'-phosphate oxidase superfamily)
MSTHEPSGPRPARPVPATPAEGAAIARGLIDGSSFMTLATADAAGVPWATPVWFATADGRELVWVSRPEARHSANIERRPDVGIVVFDSTQAPGAGQAVYMAARAEAVRAGDLERCLAVFSARSEADGLGPWTAADVGAPAPLRLYRAVVSEHFVLAATDERIAVDIGA